MTVKTTYENLKYRFTKEELAEISNSLAKACAESSAIEQRKKEITSQLKAELESQSAIMQRESRRITNGYEYRDIQCEIRYNSPSLGRKEIVRMDTGEIVSILGMTDFEKQQDLPFEEPQPEPVPEPIAVQEELIPEEVNAAKADPPLASAREVNGPAKKKAPK